MKGVLGWLSRSLIGLVAATHSALRGIVANRMRTFLSTLGIAIGVATLMTIYALVSGLTSSFSEQISMLGSDTLYVSRNPWMMRGNWWQFRNRPPISRKDVNALKEKANLLIAVAPMAGAAAEVTYQGERAGTVQVQGTTSDYIETSTLRIAVGRFLSPVEGDGSGHVAVIGSEVAERLFRQTDPLDEFISLGPQKFKIVGVLKSLGKAMGRSQDNIVIIPIETFGRIYGAKRDLTIAISAPPENMFAAKEQIIEVLRQSRSLRIDEQDNFSINQQSELLKMFNEETAALFGVAIAIGLITLVVGGIGVMNIMLVAVTERTREIGVRRALGARRRVILLQFLTESALVTMAGGAVGTAIGAIGARIIDKISPVGAELSVPAMVGALLFSALIGVAFGTWPAYRAANLDPIESLRYE